MSLATAQPAGGDLSSRPDSFDAFRAAVAESFVPLRVTCDDPDAFHGTIRAARAGRVHVTDIRATSHVVERTPALVARGGTSHFKISLLVEGEGVLRQDGRDAALLPGTLAVYDTDRPYTLSFERPFHSMVVMFPHQLLPLPSSAVGQLTATSMDGRSGLASLVTPYLTRLAGNLDLVDGPTGMQLAHSAIDLVAALLGAELAENGDGATARRTVTRDVFTYIDAHLSETDLTPTSIAAAHFISLRHLHGLFAAEGTTVAAWIRTRRLERCRRDLLDVTQSDLPISTIATRWGFRDGAHFSRAFKTAYGVAPSSLRLRG